MNTGYVASDHAGLNTSGTARTDAVTPVFLFSLPRSGSTLAQRVLATHQEIETVSEPWLLLPYFFAQRKEGVYTSYGHTQSTKALEDFCAGLPNGMEDYRSELRNFVLRLYRRHCQPSARYFLDKTPRYHLVAEEILQTFPDARFIFLWRNPLAVIASMIETWGQGNWNIYLFEIDLFEGLENLIRVYSRHTDRICAVKYEDLLQTPEAWGRVFSYVGLKFEPSRLASFSGVTLGGRMGDPTGQKAYQTFSNEPMEKWKMVLTSPLRKAWCRRYLKHVGREKLALMGYDLERLLDELKSIPTNYQTVLVDMARMLFGLGFRYLEPLIARDKIMRFRSGKRAYCHH